MKKIVVWFWDDFCNVIDDNDTVICFPALHCTFVCQSEIVITEYATQG